MSSRRDDRSGKKTSAPPAAPQPAAGDVYEFDITFDPVDSNDGLPADVDAQYGDLYRLVHDDPAAAVGRLEPLVGQFPAVPRLTNLLTAAYALAGRKEQADALTERAFRDHPGYLFAKVNYAQMLLDRGDADGALAAMGGHFNLRRMYPDRTEFHVSEVAALWMLMGNYLIHRKQWDEAERCLAFLKDVDPDHAGVKVLEHRLLMSVMERAMARLATGGRRGPRPASRRPPKRRGRGKPKKPSGPGKPPPNAA